LRKKLHNKVGLGQEGLCAHLFPRRWKEVGSWSGWISGTAGAGRVGRHCCTSQGALPGSAGPQLTFRYLNSSQNGTVPQLGVNIPCL